VSDYCLTPTEQFFSYVVDTFVEMMMMSALY